MKFLLRNLTLLVFLAFAFSGLTSCTKTPEQPPATENKAPANTNSAAADKKNSEYPPMPSAIMQTPIKLLDGTTVTLNDKKGKVLLVNLWAIWCGPCRGEMPHLVEMQEKFRDKGFEIIGLDVDDEETEPQINEFAKEMKLNYTLGWSGELRNDFSRLGQFSGIPQSYVIDRDGRLRGRYLGGGGNVVSKMKEAVEKLVNE